MKKPGSSPPSKDTPNKGGRTISRQILQAEYHGPIPPPNLLKGYDDIHPGLADRIVRMAEAESIHRQAMEQKALEADIDFGRRSFAERRLG